MFPDSFDLHVHRTRSQHGDFYIVSGDDPLPITGSARSIASALYALCTELARVIERRKVETEVRIMQEARR